MHYPSHHLSPNQSHTSHTSYILSPPSTLPTINPEREDNYAALLLRLAAYKHYIHTLSVEQLSQTISYAILNVRAES